MTLKAFLFFIIVYFGKCYSQNNCFRPQINKLEFLCPADYMEVGGFQMVVTPLKEVHIECDNLDFLNTTQFPDVSLIKINLLKFRFCPLPQGGFKKILEHFSTKNVMVIEFEYGNLKQKTLSQNYFQGLERIEFLKLSKNKFRELDEDVFSNTPNLVALELKQNYLTNLKPKTFRLQSLEWLDLSDNHLEHIPRNLFKSLKKLEFLRLWNNKLTSLNDSTFDGVSNLKSLELSSNKITKIEENVFVKLKNLVNISLATNELRSIPQNLFRSSHKLQSIQLNNNANFTLSDYLFANMSVLEEIDLSNCNLEKIPENLFENSYNLKIIRLQGNRLKKLPQNLFTNLTALEEIDLGKNQIESVEKIFTSLPKLKRLFLNKNKIKNISEKTFYSLVRLEEIHLEENKLIELHSDVFFNNERLKIIDLSKNRYSGKNSIFKDLVFLEEVYLSHNFIKDIEEVINLNNKHLLETLDLSHNQLTNISLFDLQTASEVEIFLNHNKITSVSFENIELLENPYTVIIHLDDNPIRCDCRSFDLVKYFHGEISPRFHQMFNIRFGVTCASPEEFEATDLEDIPLSMLTCPVEDGQCPEKCLCKWRPHDQSVSVNCANQNLTTLPKIAVNYSNIEVNLENNSLADAEMVGYDNVTRINLSRNKLRTISKLPDKLQILKLDYNELTSLNFETLQALNTSTIFQVSLANNPWFCGCDSVNLTKFIRQHSKQIDFKHIFCANTSIPLIDLNENDLCEDFTLIYITFPICLLLVLAISTTFYYRYNQEIKIWLFSKNLCLFWVSEDDIDNDKIYDAFISYSSLDEDFVKILTSELESGPKPYKLCLHFRDWVPGELINVQIVKSIVNSKRTVVILSKNFVDSVWGKLEFQQAHAEAMSEGRVRVIVILYDEVDVEQLDDTLKTYLKTNTYLKWGDPYFWDKLKYALPHHRNFKV